MAGDQGRGLGGQVDDGPEDIFRLADAVQQNFVEDHLPESGIFQHGSGHGRFDKSGGHGVDIDVVGSPLQGQDLGQGGSPRPCWSNKRPAIEWPPCRSGS